MQNQTPLLQALTTAALHLAHRTLTTGAPPPSKAMQKALADVCVLLEARSGRDAEIVALVGTVRRVTVGDRRG